MRRIVISLASVVLAACGGPDPAGLERGEDLYRALCADCHRGAGDGSFLKGVPPIRYTSLDYQELVELIRGHGREQDSRMPVFADLPQAKVAAIAVYVRQQIAND
jgi:mono/diheme cytochrome c family protein